MSTLSQDDDRQSRVRRWIGWIPLVAFGLAVLIGYRLWTDRLEQSPVAEVHAGFLDFMAEHSPKAREYRNEYYRKFGRSNVASRHFEQVCAAMHAAAVDDNVDPSAYSNPMAAACKSRGRKYLRGELPR
jgi:hypothetical protein